ncbi:glycosyltransferase family 2 protein [Providencia alcalifaciens]
MKISIIIATYNAEEHLESCLLSIVNSTVDIGKIEVIIIDGGSTDNTINIIKKNSSLISYYCSEKDNGIYDAWNKGIQQATTDWIMFLGADDQLKPLAIDNYLKLIENSNFDYISAKINLLDSNNKTIRVIGKKYDWKVFKHYMNVAHVASLHRKKIFEKFGLYDTEYKICGDYELLLRVKNNLKCYFLDQVVANMRIGGVSHLSYPSLLETKKAKIKNKSVSPIIAELDYIFAVVKLSIKKMIKFNK